MDLTFSPYLLDYFICVYGLMVVYNWIHICKKGYRWNYMKDVSMLELNNVILKCFKHTLSLVEIGQNVTILFVTTCDY
jgi:hypothetical protein